MQVYSLPLSKFCTESDNINRSWITTEERLKYAICQVVFISSNDPQFSKYQKPNPRKKKTSSTKYLRANGTIN